jgi:NhaP-type Na+/H+ or K+/H+ antiporter
MTSTTPLLAAWAFQTFAKSAEWRARDEMAFIIAFIAAAAFLSGSAIGILAVLVAGIRSDDRAENLTRAPRSCIEAVTRRLLGVGVRNAAADRGKDHER